jgi:outer membrane protein TolC
MKWRPWLAAPIAVALGGCDFAPRYAPPSVAVPSKSKDETAGGAALPATGAWWLAFNDRTLNELQAQVDVANPTLAAAVAANDAKIASPVDVDRAQTQLSSTEAQASDLALNRATLEDSIAALVGKAAASFSVSRSTIVG